MAWVTLAIATGTASGHSFEPVLLDLDERQAGIFEVHWQLPGPESGSLALGVADLQPQLPAHCRVVGTAPSRWHADCGTQGLHGATVSVPGIEASRIDVILRIKWLSGETATGAIHAAAPEFTVPGGPGLAGREATVTGVLWSYLGLGTEHILLGYDHLLFVLGLMLLVDSWGMLLKTISAFTVAHSVTLAAAVLGFVHVRPAPVEVLIAASIVMLALELTRSPNSLSASALTGDEHVRRKPLESGREPAIEMTPTAGPDAPATLARRYPWVVAFVFGLLHGLGFAGALTEVGVPPDRIALALLSFNLGVEIGQLTFVAVMLAPLALARPLARRWPRIRLVPAYAIGVLAMAWTFERVQRFWL
jgi:hypothetical protein